MLTKIRETASGWIAWVLVIIISIPFALWGVSSYFEGITNVVVATVNGEELNRDDYSLALDRRQSALRQEFGRNIDPAYTSSLEFKQQVIDQLVAKSLMEEFVEEQGYRISDQRLSQSITLAPQFQRDDKFDQEAYQAALQIGGYSVAGFEDLQRWIQTVGQVRNGFELSSFVFDEEINEVLKLTNQKRTADYVILSSNRYFKDIQVADEQIEKVYSDNQERYRTPEKVKVEYLQLSVADLGTQINPSEEEIKRYYEETQGNYVKEKEQRKASHILINLDLDADAIAREKALAKARDVFTKATSGTEFEQLAKEYSDDLLSAKGGGDLGWIERGALEKVVEDQLFALQKSGEIGGPVKSRFGYHVVKLTGLKPQVLESFEDARDKVLKQVRRIQAEARFVELAENFRNLVYEQPDSLQPAADELSLKSQKSEWFTRTGGKGIANTARVREAAFSDDVLQQELNSEAIEVDNDTLVSVRKIDYQRSKIRPLEEVRTQIYNQIKREKSAEQAKKMGLMLLERLRGGENWEAVLENENLESKSIPALRADAKQGVVREISELVFAAPKSKDNRVVFGGKITNSGGFGIFRLTEVVDGDPAEVDEKKKELMASTLRRRRGLEYFVNSEEGLRERAEVEINFERL